MSGTSLTRPQILAIACCVVIGSGGFVYVTRPPPPEPEPTLQLEQPIDPATVPPARSWGDRPEDPAIDCQTFKVAQVVLLKRVDDGRTWGVLLKSHRGIISVMVPVDLWEQERRNRGIRVGTTIKAYCQLTYRQDPATGKAVRDRWEGLELEVVEN